MEKLDKKEEETCYAYVDAEMAQFEEVAGTCSNKDNVDEQCCTVRSVTIGLMYVIGMSYLNQWGNFQNMAPFIASVLVIVSSFPLGHLWTLIVPGSKKFTLKEHAFILVMGNVAYMYNSVFIYATLTTLKVLEREDVNFAYYFFFVLSIQFLGFGLAGILRRFLVWPCEVIWPQNLPLIAVLRTFHERQSSITEASYGSQHLSLIQKLLNNRLLFFCVISIIAFVYEWLPLYIMPILAYFSWMCWISPSNNALAQLTAVRGLAIGGGGLSLDWYEVTRYLGSPLILPGWALINIAFGFVLIIWFIVPIVYGTNIRSFTTLPIGGVVSTEFTALSLVTAFTSFASITAVFVHALLFHGIDIWQQFRTKTLANMGNDMHARMISLYKTVPDWCYLELFALALIVACVTCDHAGWLSWYYVLLSLFIGALFTLPFGLVSSITGQLLHNLSVYYLCLLIAQSLSLQTSAKNIYTFIALGYVVFVQTLALIQDMKLAHYIKIGPRPLFAAQCLAGFVCSTFSIGIRYMYVKQGKVTDNWSIFNNTKLGWTLLNDYNGFFNGTNLANRDLLWAFLVGAFIPIPGWFLSRFKRFHWLNKLHWPLIFVTIGWMPSIVPAGALFTWLLIGLIVYFSFGKYSWRQRHVYLVSAGLDLGLNITIIIVSTAFKNKNVAFPEWWGNKNTSVYDSCDKAVQTW
ncbi:unnamed protein product [Rotaria magnacalcarata]|uniref:Uncharacterized protein n=4 Tax=Rotaria magnacalcarata TaxID=392030 RepID=A0A816VKY2_9BILA|nr:unnamed protein product [Rotaria magnacalcarata]CAF1541500.1 unnamed protein product [Rotaria magnacalcarata]CAF2063338.1 unnamed protein product [Rotaria magnacalcarata]CAF2126690.1 unnamed protein product [Rotaria magnacalcarata]CAF2171448.1 unnamed protein product [Rotaria magnacalcarata]